MAVMMGVMSDPAMAVSWERLAQRRVCFGHQSVGDDIMNALSTLSGQRLEVVEAGEGAPFRRPVFAHFRVGHNRDPFSKCQAFAQVINGGVGNRVDIAFFKFCYVDITVSTDINELFNAYQGVMASLSVNYPQVMFFHVTVPLTRVGGRVLGWLRDKCGWIDREREDQFRRHAFNQLLRGAYGWSGRLFDLAEVESTFSDGKPSFFIHRGDPVPTMVPAYTDDGGHLNQPAAERAARRLLSCLNAPLDQAELSLVQEEMGKDGNNEDYPVR